MTLALNEEEKLAIAGARDTAVGRAILKALEIEAARVEARLEDQLLDTQRLRDDMRYAMGELRGLKAVSRMIDDITYKPTEVIK